MKRLLSPALFATTMLTATVLTQPALAQDTPVAVTSDDAEIMVTAQRRGEPVLDVPMSISATSGEQLDSLGIRQMSDLQLTTPGFTPSNSSGYNQMFIRGIGNAIFVGA